MKPAIYALLAVLALVSQAGAQEEPVCMNSYELEAALIDWYGEAPVAPEADETTQLWASGIGGTWTVVTFEPNGQSCVLAQGDNYLPNGMNADLVAALGQ